MNIFNDIVSIMDKENPDCSVPRNEVYLYSSLRGTKQSSLSYNQHVTN